MTCSWTLERLSGILENNPDDVINELLSRKSEYLGLRCRESEMIVINIRE